VGCGIAEVDSDSLPLARSGLEVDLDRIDERDEPGEKLEMDGMSGVGVQCRAVRELHYTGELMPLGTWGKVDADIRLENARNLNVKAADRILGALRLCVCDTRFPSKEEGMDDHAAIVVGLPGGFGRSRPESVRSAARLISFMV
jgi:hypothetical protein